MSQPKFRLAFRSEGEFWVAYLAKPDTMEGAERLGSILLRAVAHDEKRKQAFMSLIQEMIDDAVLRVTGKAIEGWSEPVPAPEAERGGNDGQDTGAGR